MELRAYRVICLTAAGFIPAFGYLYHHIDPAFHDPMWMRWVLCAIPLALGLGTYVSAWVRARFETLAVLFVYLVITWSAVLTAVNGLAPEYAVGFMLVLMLTEIANLGVKLMWATGLCVGLAVAAAVAVAFSLDDPGVDPLMYTLCVTAGGLIIGISTWIRHGMRQHLHASEARYRAVFESTADGLFLTDARTHAFLDANGAYLALTGYTLDELRALTLHDIVVAEPGFVERAARQLLEQGRLAVGEQQHRRKDGSTILLAIGIDSFEQDGRPVFCTTAHDLTAQQRVLAELEASKEHAEEMLRLKSSLLNNMSHELRTPLVSILGFAEILAEETSEEQRQMAMTIHRSAKRLHDSVNLVLDLAQLEGGETRLQPEVLDIGAEVEEAALLLRPLAASKGLVLRVRTVPDVWARADRIALQRVLNHLISNAIKFTERGGVGVDVDADSHRVILRISDTGIGIGEEFLPYLFEEFKQESTGLGRSFEGSGLGLAITKRLVDLMGGRIMVQSVVGEGTDFAVALTRAWPSPASASGRPDAEAAVLTARPHILVVEDNADTRRFIERTLAAYYDVTTAPDAATALEVARRVWFDALLLDINLGQGPDGFRLLYELRGLSAYTYIPVLAVTGLAHPDDRERILDAGFDGYLAKPFTRDELLYTLDEVLASPHEDFVSGDGSGHALAP